MWETILVFFLSTPLIVYFWLDYRYKYWKRKNIPYVASNVLDFEWYRLPRKDYSANIYYRLRGHKFGGFYERFTPQLMIRDPELIKLVLIKDFDYFHDRGRDAVFDQNEPLTHHMFSAPGPLWRTLRTKLTPAFTSGKMKSMFNLVEECAKELTQVVGKCAEVDSSINISEFNSRYAIEVISSCAFGLKANTIRDGNSTFKLMTKNLLAPSLSKMLVFITWPAMPCLKKIFRISHINKSVAEFFYKLIRQTVNHRKINAVNRNDFVQLLINMREDEDKGSTSQIGNNLAITEEFMAAQCFIFFVAGFHSSHMAISEALYELAINEHMQRKLQNEIESFLQKHDDKINYEMVTSMPYLNQIVSETLRKYPPGRGTLARVCVRRYKIPGTDIFIEKGTKIVIPMSGLHSDPQYFPNPRQFDPERFKDCNDYASRYVYLPFGDGPRNCIASRFGLMTVKLALVYLLRDFNFELDSVRRPQSEFIAFTNLFTEAKNDIFLKCVKNKINNIR